MNPFNEESHGDDSTTNHFDNEETGQTVSTNPFGEENRDVQSGKGNNNKRMSLPSKAATVTSSSVSIPGHDEKDVQENINILIKMGYNRTRIVETLVKMDNNLQNAANALSQNAFREMNPSLYPGGITLFTWQPPFQVRIGSWLPYLQNGRLMHYSYFITVTSKFLNKPYVVEKRYSLFYQLYQSIYFDILRVFPNAMKNPFPGDRLTSWFFGTSDELLNQRREALNGWLQEIVTEPQLMTHIPVYQAICDFLEVDKHIR